MLDYQHQFINYALHKQALRFGQFTLKSGRISPYFFNAGLFNDGQSIAKLGQFYAAAIMHAQLSFDVLFGPAYKGIPLVTSAAIALQTNFQINYPYCFNRKEAKDHGEGGLIVGAALQGQVLLIDDVITAGTAFREAQQIIENAGAKIAGIVVALDRQERGQSQLSAIQEIEQQHIPVISIIKLQHLIEHLTETNADEQALAAIKRYQEMYGVL